MSELPAGTLTVLHTDVEESTQLTMRLGDRYPEVLATHHALLRAAFAAHGGREVDTQGDSFFVVFLRATQAVAAAVASQRALTTAAWPEGGAVRVRIGVHTGEPIRTVAGYTGLDVVRGARIMEAGHGGQVLLSKSTAALSEDAHARLVTHYVRHNAWIGDGSLLRDVDSLAGIPGVLVNGRFDFQAPLAGAWKLHSLWPRSELVVVNDAGHAASNPGITEELIRATDRFASR